MTTASTASVRLRAGVSLTRRCLSTSPDNSNNNNKAQFASLAQAFELISQRRCAERNLSSAPIPAPVLRRLLELTQLAPSSFNLQPCRLVLVRDEQVKASLASAMLGGNARIVAQAAASVVVLADREPHREVDELIALEIKHGANPHYAQSIRAKLALLVGRGWLSTNLRRLGTHLASPLTPSPQIGGAEVWAVKNASLAAQQMMLAAAALGVSSCPMEGFDERRVCFQLGVPQERFAVPLVVSLGLMPGVPVCTESDLDYSNNNSNDGGKNENRPKKVRFPLEKICFDNEYGKPLRI